MATTKKISFTEEELVSRLKDQDTIALQVLYDSYSGALLGVIARIIPQAEVAEDLLQETFVKIWNSAGTYDSSKGRLFTWMMNIARNISIDKLRSKDFKNSNKNQTIETSVDFIDAQKGITFNSDTLGLKELVTALKPELKSILEMVYLKGYTHAETAEALNIPIGTIKTRIRMAMVELRKKFK